MKSLPIRLFVWLACLCWFAAPPAAAYSMLPPDERGICGTANRADRADEVPIAAVLAVAALVGVVAAMSYRDSRRIEEP